MRSSWQLSSHVSSSPTVGLICPIDLLFIPRDAAVTYLPLTESSQSVNIRCNYGDLRNCRGITDLGMSRNYILKFGVFLSFACKYSFKNGSPCPWSQLLSPVEWVGRCMHPPWVFWNGCQTSRRIAPKFCGACGSVTSLTQPLKIKLDRVRSVHGSTTSEEEQPPTDF